MDSLILGSLLALATFNNVQEKLLFSAMKISLFLGILGIVFTLLYLANINETSFVNSFMQLGNTVKYANDEIGVNLFFFISLIAVGLIIACIKEHGFIFRICNIEILKHFGKISYGMYLFHYPILHFLRVISDNVMFLSVVGFTITYVVSIISFNTFELYFNRLKNKFTY